MAQPVRTDRAQATRKLKLSEHSEATSCFTAAGARSLRGPEAARNYRSQGYLSITDALSGEFCRNVIGSLHQANMIQVESRDLRGTTRFLTLNGQELIARAPALEALYLEFANVVSELTGERYTPLDNRKVGLSLNYTPPGGRFVRHFDRNEMTVSLYLNEVQDGELEIWPNIVSPFLDLFGRYKLPLALRLTRLMKAISIPPRAGTVVVFSRRTVHGVAPVVGERSRVSVIMAYDRPGRSFMHVPDYYGQGSSRVLLDSVSA